MQQVIESWQQLNRSGNTPPRHQAYNSPTRRTVSHLLANVDKSPAARSLPPPISVQQQRDSQQDMIHRLRDLMPNNQASTSSIRPQHVIQAGQDRVNHSTPVRSTIRETNT